MKFALREIGNIFFLKKLSKPKVGSLRRLVKFFFLKNFFFIFGFVLAQKFQSLWGSVSMGGRPYGKLSFVTKHDFLELFCLKVC